MTLVKATAGQLHQENLAANAVLDAVYLTGKHQTQLVNDAIYAQLCA